MNEIRTTSDGRYMLDCDASSSNKSFFKIEKLADKSNYYMLWEKEDMDAFYLYNAEKKFYALKTNTYRNAQLFRKIDFYSEETKSFVAYRSDKDYAYIVYDDGYMEQHAFLYVGEEYNGMRPVKTYGGKWLYYDTRKRKFAWAIERGYNLQEGESLGRRFNDNYFIVWRGDGSCSMRKYDEKRHRTIYLKTKYDFIEEIRPTIFVGKLRWKDVFELFVCCNTNTTIGCYNSKPVYDTKNNVFYARKEDAWCIIRNWRELYNCQWEECNFLFNGNYIFYKAISDNNWQIFDGNNGMELCYDWKNIRLYDTDDDFYMLIDTEQEKNRKVFVNDIEQWRALLITRSKGLYAQCELAQAKPTIVENNGNEQSAPITTTTTTVSQTSKASASKTQKTLKQEFAYPNKLPDLIEYCTTINDVKINNYQYLVCHRKSYDNLPTGKHICWIVWDRNAIIVTVYKHKSHKIIYYKAYDKEDKRLQHIQMPTQTLKINMKNISEERFIENLNEQISLIQNNKQNHVAQSEQPIRSFDPDKENKTHFRFEGLDYWLGIGDKWSNGTIFKNRKRQYLLTPNILAILLDSSNTAFIDHKQSVQLYYKIIGEGKDVKFDQDFNRINKAIRDNSTRIILFTGKNDEIRFLDEVRCCGYSLVNREYATGRKRKLILFDMISMTKRHQ